MTKTEGPGANRRKIAVVGPSGRSIGRLRGGLIRDLVQRGHAVLALAPVMRTEDGEALRALGADAASFVLKPEGFHLAAKRVANYLLVRQLEDFGPSAILIFGTAITAFGITAAMRARVAKIVAIVSELPEGAPGRSLSRSLTYATAIIAHNEDDRRALAASGLNGAQRPIATVAGAGVDLAALADIPAPASGDDVVFLLPARLDKEKGILEFCEAAGQLKNEGAKASFLLAGPEGTGSAPVKFETLDKYRGAVEFLGDVPDLATALARAHVVVAPSHVEGMPHAIQQAMAAGRPVIVTSVAGSRETVDDFVNGIVVPPGDAQALAGAMRRMIAAKDMIPAIGRASRAKAERYYDFNAVNAVLRGALGLA